MTQPTPPPQDVAPVVSLAAAEVATAALVLAMFGAWLALVKRAVLAAFQLFGAPPDPAGVWSTVPAWERQVDDLMAALAKIARDGWVRAAEDLGVQMPFDPSDPILAGQLQYTRNLMVRTPDDVYRIVVRQLGDAVAAGETIQQQAARVSHVLDLTGTENWEARAQTVATTEVHRAWNMGALAAALKVQASGARRLMKRWDAREDRRTRLFHKEADGQTVAVSQPFIVGLEPLMAPGDPSGSPSTVINCRCRPHFFEGA